jgi:hypothetical protein
MSALTSRADIGALFLRGSSLIHSARYQCSNALRAVTAVRECRSHDFLVLARLALEAAIRTSTDVNELLETAPRSVMPVAVAGAVA